MFLLIHVGRRLFFIRSSFAAHTVQGVEFKQPFLGEAPFVYSDNQWLTIFSIARDRENQWWDCITETLITGDWPEYANQRLVGQKYTLTFYCDATGAVSAEGIASAPAAEDSH